MTRVTVQSSPQDSLILIKTEKEKGAVIDATEYPVHPTLKDELVELGMSGTKARLISQKIARKYVKNESFFIDTNLQSER